MISVGARDRAGLLAVLGLLLIGGCGGSGAGSAADSANSDSAGVAETVASADADAGGDTAEQHADTWTPSCPGEIGCPCNTPADCDDAICLETHDGGRCSAYCGEGGCPEGWACTGRDPQSGAYHCVRSEGLVCRPCLVDADCVAGGHSGSRCVAYGDLGGFCGLPCSTDAACPIGSICREVGSVQGGALNQQCVATTADGALGGCACSPHASALQLATTCWMQGSGAAGERCVGKRSCGAEGLSPCALATGPDALCYDSQCLDAATQTPVSDGTGCDDGRACTLGDTCKAGRCSSGKQVCPCEPGVLACATSGANLCSGPLACVAGGGAVPFACLPDATQAVVCDASADLPCEKAACRPADGACELTPIERTVEVCDLPATGGVEPGCRREKLPDVAADAAAIACDDGLPCSSAAACSKGVCVTTSAKACACLQDSDCKDDGDLCNGTPYCDKTGVDSAGSPAWTCKTNPATVVSCAGIAAGPCEVVACAPATGTCGKSPAAPGAACDDGQPCTIGDVCAADSTCTPGTWTCCKVDADCASKEDGDLCNGTLFCDVQSGQCEVNPATIVSCPTTDEDGCLLSTCLGSTGSCALAPRPDGKACSDGDACTAAETCKAGVCQGGKDVCPCSTDVDCTSKEDGDLCNGTLYCNPATGTCKLNPATAVTCKTGLDTDCLQTQCQPKTGTCQSVALPAGATCDADGTACTAGDACDGKGSCLAGKSVCGCASDADCAGKEDGDLCNGTLFCDKSGAVPSCKVNPATVVACNPIDDTACIRSLCQPATGSCVLTLLNKGAPCDDGDLCTKGDFCNLGVCKAGSELVCGCKTAADCSGFDKGKFCAGAYACSGKACVFDATKPPCDDANACTVDSCTAQAGCSHTAIPGCKPCAVQGDCEDANVCTADFCIGGVCSHQVLAGFCSDGDACTLVDLCEGEACVAGKALQCDDGKVCTVDSCDSKTGSCVFDATASQGKSCGQADKCVLERQCKADVCAPTKVAACDDGEACTIDACDLAAGCTHTVKTGANCSDGSACTVDDVCSAQGCVGTPLVSAAFDACDDDDTCTSDSCDKLLGCVHTIRPDGTACGEDVAWTCQAGKCRSTCVTGRGGSDCKGCGPGYVATQIGTKTGTTLGCLASAPVWGARSEVASSFDQRVQLVGPRSAATGLVWFFVNNSVEPTGSPKGFGRSAAEAEAHCINWSGSNGNPNTLQSMSQQRLPTRQEWASVFQYRRIAGRSYIDSKKPIAQFYYACVEGSLATDVAMIDDDWLDPCEVYRCGLYEGGCEAGAIRGGLPGWSKDVAADGTVVYGRVDADGTTSPAVASDKLGVVCVAEYKATQIAHAGQKRYVVEDAGQTVRDRWLARRWQRAASPNAVAWKDAGTACSAAKTAGKSGWRLPTIVELHGLVDVTASPSIDASVFPSTPKACFWSATESNAIGSDKRWRVHFGTSSQATQDPTTSCHVRCVRGL